MATVEQIYEIVNTLAKQAYGMQGLTATSASFISIGNEVLKSDTSVDAWNKVLADRIAKTAICVRDYKASGAKIRKEGVDFGVALQRIYIDLVDAEKNTTWNSAEDEHSDPYRKRPAKIEQAIFSKISTWEKDMTVPDRQIQTAFTSAAAMGAFIGGMHTAFNNSVESAYEQVADLCRATFAAIYHSTGHSVNLLSGYNAITKRTLKTANAMSDREFLRYAACEISMCTSRLRRMSTLFNPVSYKTHTDSKNLVLTVLNDYAKRAAFYLESDTYHKDLVSLPGYESIPFWQASGTDYGFSSTSSINVKIAGDNNVEKEVQLSGILALLYDDDGMGATIDHRRIKTVRNEVDEYTTYLAKADVGYYIDKHFNGIVFYIADGAEPPVTPGE